MGTVRKGSRGRGAQEKHGAGRASRMLPNSQDTSETTLAQHKVSGEKRRDPPIPEQWANAMFDLVSADDSTSNPIFKPEEPKKSKKTLSFTPPSKGSSVRAGSGGVQPTRQAGLGSN